MKKTIGIIIMLILALLILTGCSVNVDYEVKVNKNGSGDVSYIYGFSKETLESLQVKAEDMVASMQEQAEESDYTTEYYEDDEIAGFKATKHIEKLSEDFSLQEAFGEQYIKDNENNKISIKSGILSTKVSQKGEIDLSSMEDNMKDIVKLKYTVKLPVKSSKNNATKTQKGGKILTWDLAAGEVNSIEYTAKGYSIFGILVILLIIIAVLALIYIVLKNKKNKNKFEIKNKEIKEESKVSEKIDVEENVPLKEKIEAKKESVKKNTSSKTSDNENKTVKKKTTKKEETKKDK